MLDLGSRLAKIVDDPQHEQHTLINLRVKITLASITHDISHLISALSLSAQALKLESECQSDEQRRVLQAQFSKQIIAFHNLLPDVKKEEEKKDVGE